MLRTSDADTALDYDRTLVLAIELSAARPLPARRGRRPAIPLSLSPVGDRSLANDEDHLARLRQSVAVWNA